MNSLESGTEPCKYVILNICFYSIIFVILCSFLIVLSSFMIFFTLLYWAFTLLYSFLTCLSAPLLFPILLYSSLLDTVDLWTCTRMCSNATATMLCNPMIFSCSCCCCVLEGLPRGWVARRSVWASCDSTCANGWRRWRSLAMRVHIRRVALQSVRRSIVANSWSASCPLVATVIRNVRMLES